MHRRSQDRQNRASKTQLHSHCESCYSVHCRKKVEISVSCVLTQCRLHCGTHYHLCKEEEHMLLCLNVSVPCLNAEYGCPHSMPRSKQAEHLGSCPASVVCCSMEWLRWPTNNTHPHNTITLQDNVLRENVGPAGALDLALALDDQRVLYGRLRMKPLYPEQMNEDDDDEEEKRKEEAKTKEEETRKEEEKRKEEEMIKEEERRKKTPCQQLNLTLNDPHLSRVQPQPVVSTENSEPDAGKEPNKGVNSRTYNLMERMFSMERSQCAAAEAALKETEAESGGGEGGKDAQVEGSREGEAAAGGAAAATAGDVPQQDSQSSPWHEGVLERLEQTLSPQEYNMYLVHHGRMLLHFGQIEACTPREKDFVYGSLEPIPVQTLHSFKIPVGYHHKNRVHILDTLPKAKTEARGVDTSDLKVKEDDWYSDEAEATLLGFAELEAEGHEISASKGIDGAYVDHGIQTHLFRKAPFKRRTTLGDVMADRPLRLRLQMQPECVSARNHSGNSLFTFRCGQSFHRRELPAHFRNVHSEIQMGLNSWFEERCPLAYLGCTYSQRRFQPSTHKANVTYNKDLRCFNLRPVLPALLEKQVEDPSSSTEPPNTQRKRAGRAGGGGGGQDSLSSLPYEVLCHMASFLDSLSLSQLALVSHLMRDVCSSLLQDRGMVTLHWERKTYSHGGAKWKAKPVWQFSHLFSQVDSWHVTDIHSMSAHLKACPYNETCPRTERISLPGMKNQQTDEERQSLVKQFSGSRL